MALLAFPAIDTLRTPSVEPLNVTLERLEPPRAAVAPPPAAKKPERVVARPQPRERPPPQPRKAAPPVRPPEPKLLDLPQVPLITLPTPSPTPVPDLPAAPPAPARSAAPEVKSEPVERPELARSGPTSPAAGAERSTSDGGTAVTPPSFNAAYLRNPPPRYPVSARRRGEQGTVTLRVLVTREGLPASVNVQTTSGSNALDRAAVDAVRGWRFAPARRGSNAVEAWVLVPIVFKLEETS